MVSIISMTSETPSKRREEGRTSGKIEDANRTRLRIKINNQYKKLTISTKINNQYQRKLTEQTVHPELTEC